MFIQDMLCISPQDTFGDSFFEKGVKHFDTDKYIAQEPSYGDLIPMNQLRRMSKSVRMSMGTGFSLLKKHPDIESILVGSAIGSVDSALKFLLQLIEYNEGTLTPTHFVQSTSNAIAGVLAQLGNITGYNNTHVTVGVPFETALLDAQLLFQESKVKKVLIGGVEEYSEAYYNINLNRGIWKDKMMPSTEILNSNTKGTVVGEGASFFILTETKQENSIAEIVDVMVFSFPSKNEISDRISHFLALNHLKPEDIDVVLMGRNGDVATDEFYTIAQKQLFPEKQIVVYKNLVGDFSAVSSFATWLGAKIISGVTLPQDMIWSTSTEMSLAKYVLLYNHEEGDNHGLILLKRV